MSAAVPIAAPPSDISIEVRDLSKIYRLYAGPRERLLEVIHPLRRKYHREFAALDGVSFTIPRGETVAFIGRNGSGKSTLLKIITGILTPTRGTVQVQGKVSALLELGTGFNPDMSGIENVLFTGALMGIPRVEMEKRLDDVLAFADIGDFVNQPVKSFSSGMFVRLAFAVAVHVDPEILIIDEALSVGDMRFQQKCYRRIRDFKDSGVTILFVSHDMGAVNNFCDRCLWLKDGKVERDGVPVEVVRAYSAFMNYEANEDAPAALPSAASESAAGSEWREVSHCASFGDRGAEIARVSFKRQGRNGALELLQGEEEVEFAMDVVFHKDIDTPLYGLLVKDNYGNQIIGINTFVHQYDCQPRKAGERVVFRFRFHWPPLRNGEYTLSAAIAEGTQDAHVEHHWVHDALVVQVANKDLRQRLDCYLIVDADLSEES